MSRKYIGRPDAVIGGIIIKPDLIFNDPVRAGVATTTSLGTVIVGNGLQVKNNGTLSTTVTPAFHGFVVNANGDLEYTRMTSGELAVANGDATEQYIMWEIGTSDYSWQITAAGILQIQYTDSDI